MGTGRRLLPAYNHLVIDEAHRLEGAATEALTTRTDRAQIDGALDRMRVVERRCAAVWTANPEWQRQSRALEEAARRLSPLLAEFAASLHPILPNPREGIRPSAGMPSALRLDSGMRAQPR